MPLARYFGIVLHVDATIDHKDEYAYYMALLPAPRQTSHGLMPFMHFIAVEDIWR